MAHMIPDTPPTLGPGSHAEHNLYMALKEHLPDDFFVYHGLQYLREDYPIEGEADFLVVHREHGLLVIECKGHGVRVTGNGKWIRILSGNYEQELKCSPFEQAKRHIHDLVKELGLRSRRLFPQFRGDLPFHYGSSVAFPLAKLDEIGLPLEVTRKVIFDVTGNAYRLTDSADQTLATPLSSDGNHVVSFETDSRFRGVTLAAADFGGAGQVAFDEMGAPSAGGSIDLLSGSTRYRIQVAPFTGRITVAPVTGG